MTQTVAANMSTETPDKEPPIEMDADLMTAAQAAIDASHSPTSFSSAGSPFALQDDHEFPLDGPVDPVKAGNLPTYAPSTITTSVTTTIATTLAAPAPAPTSPPPALPGTPLSPYRHCACIAVLPGRVCSFCLGSKWTRICPECAGEGRTHPVLRGRQDRSQPCGFCGTKGILPAFPQEIRDAEEAALAAVGDGDPTQAEVIMTEAPEFRRAVRLPGIGATEKKRRVKVLPSQRKKQAAARRAAKAS